MSNLLAAAKKGSLWGQLSILIQVTFDFMWLSFISGPILELFYSICSLISLELLTFRFNFDSFRVIFESLSYPYLGYISSKLATFFMDQSLDLEFCNFLAMHQSLLKKVAILCYPGW